MKDYIQCPTCLWPKVKHHKELCFNCMPTSIGLPNGYMKDDGQSARRGGRKMREFYVELFGDPSDDKEVYKRYCSAEIFKPVGMDAEVVHFIEYAAYEKLKKEIEEAAGFVKEMCEAACNYKKNECEGCNVSEWQKRNGCAK